MKVDTQKASELILEIKKNFTQSGGVKTSKYVEENIQEDIDTINAYLNSKHTSGKLDSLGREKPFFNIVTSARNIWYRATDIDRKNVNIIPTKSKDAITAFVAEVILKEWMNKVDFGSFLNKVGMEMAGFNSCVTKFVEKGGKLSMSVIPWGRLLCDTVDFDNNPKVEILKLTPAQLSRKGYDKKVVDKLIDASKPRELNNGEQVDDSSDYITLYELHGELPKSYITGRASDKNVYIQQMHVVSFVDNGEEDNDFSLYSGQESVDPYLLGSLIPSTDGSISLNGSVKTLFESQWMINHTMKSIKDQMDIASKLMFQTSDPNIAGRSMLTAVEQGEVIIHAPNQPLTQVDNSSHDIGTQESFGNMWKSLSNEIAGVSESMLGQTAPSGTAWRQVQAILNESHSLFNIMQQNKGLYVERMMRIFIIPYIKKQMNNSNEISSILESHNISKIDEMYVPNEAIKRYNKEAIDKILAGSTPKPYDAQNAQQNVRNELAVLGNQRFFKPSDISSKTWKDVLEGFEWRVSVNVTGESKDTQDVLTTLSTALQAVANPNYENNPQAKLVVSKILQATNVISPLELSVASKPQPVSQAQNTPQYKVSESIAFKDLPPEGQAQMAQQAGIKLQPQSQPTPQAQPTQPAQTGLPTKQ